MKLNHKLQSIVIFSSSLDLYYNEISFFQYPIMNISTIKLATNLT